MSAFDRAGLHLMYQASGAARFLPTVLFPGNESIALACLTYVYSPQIIQPLIDLASKHLEHAGFPPGDIPPVCDIGSTLLQSQAAAKLGMQQQNKHQTPEPQSAAVLECQGSCLPLELDWMYSQVGLHLQFLYSEEVPILWMECLLCCFFSLHVFLCNADSCWTPH